MKNMVKILNAFVLFLFEQVQSSGVINIKLHPCFDFMLIDFFYSHVYIFQIPELLGIIMFLVRCKSKAFKLIPAKEFPLVINNKNIPNVKISNNQGPQNSLSTCKNKVPYELSCPLADYISNDSDIAWTNSTHFFIGSLTVQFDLYIRND